MADFNYNVIIDAKVSIKSMDDLIERNKTLKKVLKEASDTGSKGYKTLREEYKNNRKEIVAFNRDLNNSKPIATRFTEGLITSFKKLGGVLAATFAAGQITQFGKSLFDFARNFEAGFARVNTVAQLSKDELDELQIKAIELGKNFGGNIEDIPAALFDAVSGLGDVDQALELLESSLVATDAGFAELDSTMKAGLNIYNAVQDEVSSTAEVFDILFQTQKLGVTDINQLAATLPTIIPIFKTAGFGFTETAAALATLTKAGIGTAESGTALAAFATSISQSGQKMEAEFGKGSIFDEATGNVKPFVEIVGVLQEELGTLSDEQLGTYLKNIGVTRKESVKAISALVDNLELLQEQDFLIQNESIGEMGRQLELSGNRQREWNVALNETKAELFLITKEGVDVLSEGLTGLLGGFTDLLKSFRESPDLIDKIIVGTKVLVTLLTLLSARFLVNRVLVKAFGEQLTKAAIQQQFMNNRIVASVRSLGFFKAALITVRRGFVALKGAFLSNPFGILVTAATTLVTLMPLFSSATEDVTGATQRLTDATIRLEEEYVKEQAGLESLFEQLKRTNPETEERTAIIEELQKNYGEYIGNLDLETASLEDIEKAQKGANDQLAISLALKQRNNDLAAIQAERIQKIQDINEEIGVLLEDTDTKETIRAKTRIANVQEELKNNEELLEAVKELRLANLLLQQGDGPRSIVDPFETFNELAPEVQERAKEINLELTNIGSEAGIVNGLFGASLDEFTAKMLDLARANSDAETSTDNLNQSYEDLIAQFGAQGDEEDGLVGPPLPKDFKTDIEIAQDAAKKLSESYEDAAAKAKLAASSYQNSIALLNEETKQALILLDTQFSDRDKNINQEIDFENKRRDIVVESIEEEIKIRENLRSQQIISLTNLQRQLNEELAKGDTVRDDKVVKSLQKQVESAKLAVAQETTVLNGLSLEKVNTEKQTQEKLTKIFTEGALTRAKIAIENAKTYEERIAATEELVRLEFEKTKDTLIKAGVDVQKELARQLAEARSQIIEAQIDEQAALEGLDLRQQFFIETQDITDEEKLKKAREELHKKLLIIDRNAAIEKLRILGENGTLTVEKEIELKDQVIEINQQLSDEELKLAEETAAKKKLTQDEHIEYIKQTAGLIADLFQGLNNLRSAQDEAEIARIDENIEVGNERIRKLEDQLANASEAQEQGLLRRIETEKNALAGLNEEKKKLAEEEFERNKNLQYANAVINIAGGVAQALNNPPPYNFIVAALVAAAGALEIATISATKFQFRLGGLVKDGGAPVQMYANGGKVVKLVPGMQYGPSHEQGGIKGVVKPFNRPIEFEGNEWIASGATTKMFHPILESLQSLAHGSSMPKRVVNQAPYPYYRLGGFTASGGAINTQDIGGGLTLVDVVNAISNQNDKATIFSLQEFHDNDEEFQYIQNETA